MHVHSLPWSCGCLISTGCCVSVCGGALRGCHGQQPAELKPTVGRSDAREALAALGEIPLF